MDARTNTLFDYYQQAMILNPSLANDEFLDYCYEQACLEFEGADPDGHPAESYATPEAKAIIGYVELLEEYMEG